MGGTVAGLNPTCPRFFAGRVTWACAAVFALVVSMGMAGAAVAAPAGHRSYQRIDLASKVVRPSATGSGPQCFYTVPDCTSTNPDVTFQVVSDGDSSDCEFQDVVDWGDGNTTTQDVAGGPDGSVLATFDHTYTDPGTYTINWTATVTFGDDCAGSTAQLQFTLASAQVAGVRYASLSATTPGTPGLPVIKDDELNGGVADPEMDHKWGPASCAGLTDPKDYDWLDCSGTGTPDKDWPVIYATTDTVTVDSVVFTSPSDLTDPMLTADADIGGQELTLASTPLTSTSSGGQYLLSASGLAFSGALPGTPGLDDLDITWTITVTVAGNPIETPAGESISPVFVTAAAYTTPGGRIGSAPPYISLLDVGTEAADDQSGDQAVFDAIWGTFETREIAHPILDPATGDISEGPDFRYYDNGYTTIGDWWNKSLGTCPPLIQAIAEDTGHCGDWAIFLAQVLAYQGIKTDYLGLGNAPGFYSGPDPAAGASADDYAFMLVDPDLWNFTTKNATGPYPYADDMSVAGGKVVVKDQSVTYSPSSTPIAQGDILTPPEMFYTGDHAIVQTPWGFADPSYGQPQSTTLYPAIPGSYENAALAGFAVIFYKDGGRWHPLALGNDVASVCAARKCQFRAVPYDQSGAP